MEWHEHAPLSESTVTEHILFDNSALNYISGQEQRGFRISDADRQMGFRG